MAMMKMAHLPICLTKEADFFSVVLYYGNMTVARKLLSPGKSFTHNDKGIRLWLALSWQANKHTQNRDPQQKLATTVLMAVYLQYILNLYYTSVWAARPSFY